MLHAIQLFIDAANAADQEFDYIEILETDHEMALHLNEMHDEDLFDSRATWFDKQTHQVWGREAPF